MTVLEQVAQELARARAKHAPMHSVHEGYAVLLEEVDELWDEVRGRRRACCVRKEAIQIAAMAVRLIEDVCDREPSR